MPMQIYVGSFASMVFSSKCPRSSRPHPKGKRTLGTTGTGGGRVGPKELNTSANQKSGILCENGVETFPLGVPLV